MIGTQKGTIILTIPHLGFRGLRFRVYGLGFALGSVDRGLQVFGQGPDLWGFKFHLTQVRPKPETLNPEPKTLYQLVKVEL